MKLLRITVFALVALLSTSLGVVAQHDHDHGTPEAGDHHDHGDGHGHGTEGMSLGSFYFTITNNGEETDRLVMVETDVAEVVEIHNVEMDGSVMQMQHLEDGVEIGSGESIVFEPGSYHIMLIGLTESLLNGEEFTATLHFENAGEVDVTVSIHISDPESDDLGEAVTVGDEDEIEVSNVWARQAPKLDDGMATPMATPDATPGN